LKPLVRWSNGIAVRYEETKLLFDPLESDPDVADLFISHAHYDHARGFQFPAQKKYSTRETREIYEADSGHKIGNWEEVRYGRRVKIDGVSVEAHDAGHVMGSAQYEIITPEGIVLYASHINFADTLLCRAAQIAPCDTLVVQTAFGSPSFVLPPREAVVADIVKWAMECINDRRVPAFETDSIGNAQELVRIFNTWTEIPVIVHPRIARINRVYESKGIGLRYQDASTEEASRTMEDSRSIVIVPRYFDTSRYGNFRRAYVSSWARKIPEDERRFFPLSDQTDFEQLLRYIEETKPKTVVTFSGASDVFARIVSKRLGVPAKHLVAEKVRRKTVPAKLDEQRILRCQQTVLRAMQSPNFAYERRDLIAMGVREGFRSEEVEETLARLTKAGVLKYAQIIDCYSLS
jgi:metal-dependent hydrolase (beta-lactamase superfamily II)